MSSKESPRRTTSVVSPTRGLPRANSLLSTGIPRLNHNKSLHGTRVSPVGRSPPRKRTIVSPVRRSGSPERRQIIQLLEKRDHRGESKDGNNDNGEINQQNTTTNTAEKHFRTNIALESPLKRKRVKFAVNDSTTSEKNVPDISLETINDRISSLEQNQLQILQLLTEINEKMKKLQ